MTEFELQQLYLKKYFKQFRIPEHYNILPYKNEQNNNLRVALCCIAKNESLYINEWLKYNLALGFDQIILYNNDQNPKPLLKIVGNQPRVRVIHFPCAISAGVKANIPIPQIIAYNKFLINFGQKFSHVAFLDIDEFLVLKKHDNIKALINEHFTEKTGLLAINRYNFGTNGHDHYKNLPVVERFTKRESNENLTLYSYQVKSIAKICSIKNLGSVHKSTLHKGFDTINTKGKISLDANKNCDCDYSVVQLNHYVTKSIEECKQRERFKGTIRRQAVFKCNHDNFNQVEDLSARNFWRSLPG